METVGRNAMQALALHKTKRATDLTARGRALEEIQSALSLAQAPLRIECYDISNLQGTNVVASMVVFEDGLARKSEYRRFAINSVGDAVAAEGGAGQDRATANDVAAIHEVISRRFRRYLDERSADIIRSRYGLVDGRQHKLADIGARHGISAERVRQLEREALARLRLLGDPDLAA